MVLQLQQCGRIITEYTLPCTLAKSPNCLSRLISLSLTGACRLSDKGLQLLVSSATTLRSINLSQCSLLTFASLDILADSLGSLLKELYLDDCILIDVALILSALKRLEHLEVLSLAGLPTVTDKFIKNYIITCGHNINELVLRDCFNRLVYISMYRNLTDASMKFIAEHCPELHALDITNLCKLTDLTIRYLANSCRALLNLKLCRNSFSDEAIAAFLEINGKSLEELSLNNIKKVGQQTSLSLAKNAKNLHTLDLSWCRNLTDNEFGLIVDSCSSLRFLKLFGCSQVTNAFLKGHSNSELQIIGLKLCPLLQHIKEPNPHQSVLRYSSVSQ
ncbi:putative leucine-rich repeat domain, L domain-containing protein [Medicago truncatula]|uniref:Putative leucine-rich repeat domain, L domain-containing protein n=1 Tax=Medicago truncatula TaxID=3880 RepID=A0A396IG94_MEDTR|nr:putative leucine-rich repeat domain, L domain-containing protein [Medicago truncatula]